MEDTHDARSLPVVVIHTVLLGTMALLSLIGNSLVCLAFYRNRRLRTMTNFYVLSLAVADIMVAVFVFLFQTVASGISRWPFSNNMCQFSGYLLFLWTTVSLWTLALTSINRYFCVVKPQRYSIYFTRKKTILSILSVWIFQFFLCVTYNSVARSIYRWHPNRLFCKENYRDLVTEKVASITFTFFFVLSMLLIFVGYGRVYRVVRQHNRAIVPSLQHEAANNQGAVRYHEIKACRVLFAAVFGFCVSWIPTTAIIFCESALEIPIPVVAKSIPPLFSSISAWINPIIYGVMNRAMRKEFQNILRCRKIE